jgi:membrane protein implicated in regulation of membrane protease activity
MYLVLIAWLYVTLMMAIAEAISPVGSILGAIVTFLLYGVLPMTVVGYILHSPARRRARQAQEAQASSSSPAPNASRETPAAPIASVREEP